MEENPLAEAKAHLLAQTTHQVLIQAAKIREDPVVMVVVVVTVVVVVHLVITVAIQPLDRQGQPIVKLLITWLGETSKGLVIKRRT